MFISQIKKSEKQNTRTQVKQNAFVELDQEAARGPCGHLVEQPLISLLLCRANLLNLQLH